MENVYLGQMLVCKYLQIAYNGCNCNVQIGDKMDTKAPRRALSLRIENLMRVKAVFIEFRDDMTIITGKNDQGKSSTIKAFWLAVGGKNGAKSTDDALRNGTDEGFSEIDFGDIIVKKTYKRSKDGSVKSSLELRNKEGAIYKSAQTLLDTFLEALSIDPIKFKDMPASEQRDLLMNAIGKAEELTELDAKRQGRFDQRTEVNRKIRDLDGTLKGMAIVEGIEKDAEEKGMAELLRRIEVGRLRNDANKVLRDGVDEANRDMQTISETVDRLKNELERENHDLAVAVKRAVDLQAEVYGLPHDVDIAKLNNELEGIDDHNRKVRAHQARAEVVAKIDTAQTTAEGLTTDIETVDADKAKILADAKLPLAGLGVDDRGVTFEGVSLKDCSESKQIRISVAMAMALNPKIRMIMIRSGSGLDSDSLAMIHDMGKENNFHIVVERVDDKTPGAVVIEDGMVQGVAGD